MGASGSTYTSFQAKIRLLDNATAPQCESATRHYEHERHHSLIIVTAVSQRQRRHLCASPCQPGESILRSVVQQRGSHLKFLKRRANVSKCPYLQAIAGVYSHQSSH
jgi:hypothetical protein